MQETGHADALKEPFAGLFTQGMVVHETYRDANGGWVSPSEIRVDLTPEGRRAARLDNGAPVEIGPIEKMSKSKRNTIDPPTRSSKPTAPIRPAGSCSPIRRRKAT